MAVRSKSRIAGNILDQLKDSAANGKLVVVIGTGSSVALTEGKYPGLTWRGLIESGFAYCVTKDKIPASKIGDWEKQINSSDLDEFLGAAEFIGRKLEAPDGDLYGRWLEGVFKPIKPKKNKMADAIRALAGANIPLCTLNYDTLVEDVTGLNSYTIKDVPKVGAWMRREGQGILHLHGSWEDPASCVIGIRDYAATVGSEVRDLVQRALGSFNHLLFVGCGNTFADPNFSALIKWQRRSIKTGALQHYALVRESEVAACHKDSAWQGFVEPISYGETYEELPQFLLKHFRFASPRRAKTATRQANTAAVAAHTKTLDNYRAFLQRDCGEMTIEGVRADIDTAQRRFDLERLFVPLNALPIPPEISRKDPEREQKLAEWLEENSEAIPFGAVFEKHQRLALLALPGGGKTLLLKRLAVAYADQGRRLNSDDALPDVNLTPVLVRCREWREHIRRPIPVILQNLATITGQASLANLDEALMPLLKTGRVLLLIDGLDEIHNDADRATFVDHLEQFLNEYKLVRLVVTSREAGFSLVAPSIARFCVRWRIAPLDENAIKSLCDHWQRLMIGDSPEALAESAEISSLLLDNYALRSLAENPLLLTMLLVVKHGAGRLPPDRVSLYSRAVEVLLDTWNIKGHEPLSVKVAVPQLACIAFELMRQGKQTATEKELLSLLEDARDQVPQIRLYAKDDPEVFFRRVELRSSLLVEAGHQLEGVHTVPFYQFRHLTFQEHLASVAAAEGHYLGYSKGDTVLTPLAPYLTAEEWKEVIPMAAVLAKKHADPLLSALVQEGAGLRDQEIARKDFPERAAWLSGHRIPAVVSRLVQCLTEEAEAAPDTLTAALQVISFFAHGCQSGDNWQKLARGPYGEGLLHQAWLLYAPMHSPHEWWARNTLAFLAYYRHSHDYWIGHEGTAEIVRLLRSNIKEERVRALMTIAGLLWGRVDSPIQVPLVEIECRLFDDDPAVWNAAVWAWLRAYNQHDKVAPPSSKVLDRFLFLWMNYADSASDMVVYTLGDLLGLPRAAWSPVLTDANKQLIREEIKRKRTYREFDNAASVLTVAFHAGDVWTDKQLSGRLRALKKYSTIDEEKIQRVLEQIEQAGQSSARRKVGPKVAKKRQSRSQPRRV
jgi:hypothetical protein